jgi:hypothetical protein
MRRLVQCAAKALSWSNGSYVGSGASIVPVARAAAIKQARTRSSRASYSPRVDAPALKLNYRPFRDDVGGVSGLSYIQSNSVVPDYLLTY